MFGRKKGKIPELPQENITEEFSLDEVLNNEEFMSFLSKYLDLESLEMDEKNKGIIETRFKVWEQQKETAGKMVEFYRAGISKDTGVELSDEDMEAMSKLIESWAIKEPKRVERLAKQMTEHEELEKRISEKEKELEDLGGKEVLEERRDILATVVSAGVLKRFIPGFVRIFGSKEEKAAFKKIDEYGVKSGFGAVKEYIGAEKMLMGLAGLEKQKQDLAKARGALLRDTGFSLTIIQDVKKKAQARLAEMADPKKDLSDWEEAQEYLDQLKEAGVFGPSYLKGLDTGFQGNLDKLIRAKIVTGITEAVKSADIGSRPLDSLERALTEFISKESIGSKKGEEAKKFFRDELKKIMSKTTDKIKKLLLKKIIIKSL